MYLDTQCAGQILKQQTQTVELYDGDSFLRGSIEPEIALWLMGRGDYAIWGHSARVKGIRPLRSESQPQNPGDLHEPSRTIRRIRSDRDAHGKRRIIAPKKIVEHRPTDVLVAWNAGRLSDSRRDSGPVPRKPVKPLGHRLGGYTGGNPFWGIPLGTSDDFEQRPVVQLNR